jgi:hypothetical protein
MTMTDDTHDLSQTDWESEGGAPAPEPKRKTLMGHMITAPKRDSIFAAFKKVVRPVKKP